MLKYTACVKLHWNEQNNQVYTKLVDGHICFMLCTKCLHIFSIRRRQYDNSSLITTNIEFFEGEKHKRNQVICSPHYKLTLFFLSMSSAKHDINSKTLRQVQCWLLVAKIAIHLLFKTAPLLQCGNGFRQWIPGAGCRWNKRSLVTHKVGAGYFDRKVVGSNRASQTGIQLMMFRKQLEQKFRGLSIIHAVEKCESSNLSAGSQRAVFDGREGHSQEGQWCG